ARRDGSRAEDASKGRSRRRRRLDRTTIIEAARRAFDCRLSLLLLPLSTAGERATLSAPLAWLRYEFEGTLGGTAGSTRCLVDVISWPGGTRRTLAEADSHGLVVNWR